MRIATFVADGIPCAGIAYGGGYLSFNALLGEGAPQTALEFIRKYGGGVLPDFTSVIAEKSLKPIPPENVSLCSPIPNPFRSVICLGKNYLDHAKELSDTMLATQDKDGVPTSPVFFAKNASPAPGDGGIIPLHSHFTEQVDYEVELAVIIGKTVKSITPEDAESAVFGYTVLNDVTARDVQTKYGQWFLGKSLDMFCPMGPHIVTKDEISFPPKLDICCRVNGETRQHSNTSNLIYDIARVISELSKGITLEPGDIIATGTPGGIGHAKNPPVYLKKCDKVECEIEGIGVLTNYFE